MHTRWFKQILSYILVFTLTFSNAPLSVAAEGSTEGQSVEVQQIQDIEDSNADDSGSDSQNEAEQQGTGDLNEGAPSSSDTQAGSGQQGTDNLNGETPASSDASADAGQQGTDNLSSETSASSDNSTDAGQQSANDAGAAVTAPSDTQNNENQQNTDVTDASESAASTLPDNGTTQSAGETIANDSTSAANTSSAAVASSDGSSQDASAANSLQTLGTANVFSLGSTADYYVPSIEKEPEDVTCVKGKTATLTVSATVPDDGVLTYQWFDDKTGSSIYGAVEANYAVPTDKIGETAYHCELTNTVNGQTYITTSSSATVTVREAWDGSGTKDEPFLLKTDTDLIELQTQVADGSSFSGIYFQMADDITLPDDWTPIGSIVDENEPVKGLDNLHAFSGIIDGAEHTLTVPDGGQPLLGYVYRASVKKLKISGTRINGAGLVNNYTGLNTTDGSEFDCTAVTIDNVTLLSGSSTLKSGLVASVGGNEYGGVVYAHASAGFIVKISNCKIEEGVTIGYDHDQSHIGSFAGRINCVIEDCTSAADVYGDSYVGGILGGVDNSMGTCEIRNCEFSGSVNASGSYAGGILGGGYDNDTAPNGTSPTIVACKVTGDVNGDKCVGGILGGDGYVVQTWDNVAGFINANEFTGTVSGSKYVGAIIGYRNSLNIYDTISGNTYSADCGADKGIAFVKYLDTSYKNPATMTGTTVVNTADGTDGCPAISEWFEWKAKHNRTDNPLGSDASKLCKKLGSSSGGSSSGGSGSSSGGSSSGSGTSSTATCYGLEVSGDYKNEYTVGDELDLSGIEIAASWTDRTTTYLSLSDMDITGYNKNESGVQTITLTYEGVNAYIRVIVKPASETISVTVSILGDTSHGETDNPHGLARGGLETWCRESVTATTDETVWDVLQRVATDNNISIDADSNSSYGTVYIRAVDGLGELDNGSNSGWMYTINGSHPDEGVSAKFVEDGDRIILHYTDDYTYEEDGGNYGQDPDTSADAAAEEVDNLIANIGTVSYTDSCMERIEEARKAYNSLSSTQKSKVSLLSVLEDALSDYETLEKEYGKDEAYDVINLINQIGTNITLSSESAIDAARTAYDKLSSDQEDLVTNYDKLVKAEAAFAELTATDGDREKAKAVSDMIGKLGTITLESEKAIEAARAAYDSLTDAQKLLVENADVQQQAEAALAALKGSSKIDDVYLGTGDYLANLGTPNVGSIGGEWMALGLLRSGRKVDEAYYETVVKYVQDNINENERLHKAKSTDNSRIILALTAMGKDVTDVGGHNLLAGLNDMDYIQKQGINGPMWALIALDCGNYPVPEGNVTREGLIQTILLAQTSDGGWAISGDTADSDMTGIALQALAPYYKTNSSVRHAVDTALVTLSNMQDADGGYSTLSGNGKSATSESTSQVIVALTALGINPDTDTRFIKNGSSPVDALLTYYVQGGGFKHVSSGSLDGMATEQGYYALTAYHRLLDGKTSLYNMTDVIDKGAVTATAAAGADGTAGTAGQTEGTAGKTDGTSGKTDGSAASDKTDGSSTVSDGTDQTIAADSADSKDSGKNGASLPWAAMILSMITGFAGGAVVFAIVLPKLRGNAAGNQ